MIQFIIGIIVVALTFATYSNHELLTPAFFASCQGRIKKSLGISPVEIPIHALLLSVFLVLASIRNPARFANWWIHALRHFPYFYAHEKERLCAATWFLHYTSIAYNIGAFRSLSVGNSNNANSGSKKRRAYALAVSGLGYVLGICFVWSHSFIETGAMPMQRATYNLTSFLMTLSPIAIGGLLLLTPKLAALYGLIVGASIILGISSSLSMPGIILMVFGLVAFLTAPKREFPTKFKIGHVMLLMFPVILKLMDVSGIDPDSNLGRLVGAGWVAFCGVVQRSS